MDGRCAQTRASPKLGDAAVHVRQEALELLAIESKDFVVVAIPARFENVGVAKPDGDKNPNVNHFGRETQ
jgi:hypothetical protein